jgi:CTP synthase (UTP-ammonia lyase)
MKDAHSTEMNPKTSYPVITILDSQKKILENGDI